MTNTTGAPTRTIALMLESDGPGGAEIMLLQLAEELRRRGHRVLPVGPYTGCGWLGGEFRNRGFEHETFHLRRPLDRRCLREMTAMLGDHQVDLIHSHEFTMAVYGAAAARRLGRPHVVTMHGSEYVMAKWRRRVALRWAFRNSRAVIAVSRATHDHMVSALGVNSDTLVAIPNGIRFEPGDRGRVRQELGLSDEEVLVIAVGNLIPRKGHIHLLRALAALPKSTTAVPWRLAIAGGGDAGGRIEKDRLQAFAQEAGVADRVHLLGHRDDIADLIAASDVFAMPSLWEGLPVALLEAMFGGRAIIASGVSGIPEAIIDGEEGLLTPPADEAAIGQALARLLPDGALRARFGAAARRHAERAFSVGVMTDAYERCYGFRD